MKKTAADSTAPETPRQPQNCPRHGLQEATNGTSPSTGALTILQQRTFFQPTYRDFNFIQTAISASANSAGRRTEAQTASIKLRRTDRHETRACIYHRACVARRISARIFRQGQLVGTVPSAINNLAEGWEWGIKGEG